MPKLHRLAAVVAASTTLVFAAAAAAAPVTVKLRVEGSTQTVFEGPVTTDAKTLTKDSTGPHACDGTNGHQNVTPGPTATAALDDGSIAGGFTWAATWSRSFHDFFITRVGPDTGTSTAPYLYWSVYLNGIAASVGGCQLQVQPGDNVLWAYTNGSEPLLELSGTPSRAATGESFTVTVQQNDGTGNETPAAGADVDGHTTDGNGHATLAYNDAGVHTFKASRAGSIRSNAASVCVYVPGSGDCTAPGSTGGDQSGTSPSAQSSPSTTSTQTTTEVSHDTTPPVIRISSPRPGALYRRGPRLLSGEAKDAGGIAQVFLRLRLTSDAVKGSAARCRWFSGARQAFTHRTVPCSKARFFRIGSNPRWSYLLPERLRTGHYVLDVKVLDRSYNAGRGSVPVGVR